MVKKIIKLYWFQYHQFRRRLAQYQYNKKLHNSIINTKSVSGIFQFDIIVPLYNTPENYFIEMVESVLNQSYQNWRLILVDASTNNLLESIIMNRYKGENRIKYYKLKKNLGIAENTNVAFAKVTGDYCMLLDHDDFLAVDALESVYKVLDGESSIDLVYTNEDKYDDQRDFYFDPYYKGSPDIYKLRNNNYICHLLIISKDLLKQVVGERSQYDGAQDHDFILRCFEKAKKIKHVPIILYHWRVHDESTSAHPESKHYAYEAGERAIIDHLARSKIKAEVIQSDYPGFYHVFYQNTTTRDVAILFYCSTDTYKINLIFYNLNIGNEKIFLIDSNGKIINYKTHKIVNFSEIKFEYLIIINEHYSILNDSCIKNLIGICKQDKIAAISGKVVSRFGVVQTFGAIKKHHYLEILPFGQNIITQETQYINLNLCCLKVDSIKDHEFLTNAIIKNFGVVKKGDLIKNPRLLALYEPSCIAYFKS
ncbi:glycosyltransferase [Beduini massiliensis]|uniref:glycosyltransferase n=1 Tax=Beduini massiliensis TaxID=1585974 RepID=UPI000694E8BE|nr:glycosyltransferase [Beduini massiliensis]